MRLEFPLILLVALLLLDGCGSRGGSTEASIPHGQEPPRQQWDSPSEPPKPAYDMPLEIHIEAPSPPEKILGPSPPVPPETPSPRGLIDSFFKGSSK